MKTFKLAGDITSVASSAAAMRLSGSNDFVTQLVQFGFSSSSEEGS